jgi:hypothetical protein
MCGPTTIDYVLRPPPALVRVGSGAPVARSPLCCRLRRLSAANLAAAHRDARA